MFGKIFSDKGSKKSGANVSSEKSSAENAASENNSITDVIFETLNNYQSENFPQGIIVVSDNYQLNHQKDEIVVGLTMPFPCAGELQLLAESLSETLSCNIVFNININVKTVRQHKIPNVGNIIAVASGKGGVGKSTTSVNLAYALIAEGAKVGILDADIYGPSIPSMIGLKSETPKSHDGKTMIPIESHGLSAMSIGFLVPDEEATVWRGPMASRAFSQLLNETSWPELDYLIIDMPPGTGDIQLTLAQQVPVAAAVIVTTPQDIALIDASKGLVMFDKVQVPVLGIVENMSYHICENCGHHSHLFGKNGGVSLANEKNTKLLGQLPLNIDIRQRADKGESAIIENSTSEIALQYRKIARNVAAQLFLQLDTRSPQTAAISKS